MPRRPTEAMDDAARSKAVAYEAEFGVRCLVVENPLGVITKRDAPIYTLFLCPKPGDREAAFDARACACGDRANDAFVWEEVWDFDVVMGMSDWTQWFRRFQGRPDEFPLKDAALGANLIGRVVYGQDLMDQLHYQARVFFQEPGIIEIWRREAPLRREAKLKELQALDREYNRLLNRFDREHICRFLPRVAQRCAKQGITHLVAVERSGRPLGRALEWYLPNCPPVFYADFHSLKRCHGPDDLAALAAVLATELPELYRALRDHPQTVCFLEDMVGYGNTGSAIRLLVDYISGQAATCCLVCLAAEPPSWWRARHKHVIGVSLRGDGDPSFLTLPNPSPASDRFYRRLQRLVEQCKAKSPAQ